MVTGQGEPTGETSTDSRDDSLGLAGANSGPGPLADGEDVHSGWVHVVAHGETYDVTFDARICHGVDERGTVDLTRDIANSYLLTFGTEASPETRSRAAPSDGGSDCDFGTRITGGGRIPTDFEELRVTAGSDTIQTVLEEGTMPIMRPLPDPIDS